MDLRDYFVPCPPGLDGVTAGELAALGATEVRRSKTGVACRGDAGLRHRANLWLRAAIRVLEPILRAEVRSPEGLYDAVRSVDWSLHMRVDQTLAVDSRLSGSKLRHTGYASLKVKDAIVDQFREKTGARPDVDAEAPDLPLHLYIGGDRMTLSRDTSGTTLHKRGYREALVKSPLNEALAAGIVSLTRWDRASALADPMCGSGTIPIEAAMIAAKRAPGLLRARFPFEAWPDHDPAAWERAREEARAQALASLPFAIHASDRHEGALDLARRSARTAGVEALIRFSVSDVGAFAADPPPGTFIINPPYGDRLDAEADLPAVYRRIGAMLRRYPGAKAWVLSGNASLTRFLGLKASKELTLWNGAIECRLLRYEIHARRPDG